MRAGLAEHLMALPSHSKHHLVSQGLPPPLLHGEELRPERVTCLGQPSWSVAQMALGQAVWLWLCGKVWGRALSPAGPLSSRSQPEVFSVAEE